MGTEPMDWVFEHSKTDGAARTLLLTIAWYADNTSWQGWPSIEEIARRSHLSRATVFRTIAETKALGELKVIPGHGRGHSNRYQINPERYHHETLSTPHKGSHHETEGTGKGLKKVSSTQIKGLTGETRTVKNPRTNNGSHPETNSERAENHTPDRPPIPWANRCARCQKLTFDCLCFDGPSCGFGPDLAGSEKNPARSNDAGPDPL